MKLIDLTPVLTTSDIARQLVAFCRAGQFIEAQTELMAPDCRQVEPDHADAPSVNGLQAILAKEKAFQAAIDTMHGIIISEPVVAGNFFGISMHFDMTLHHRGRIQLNELGVYEVRDGKIIWEQFFY